MSTRNLFALLVGINDYPIESHRLFGCHNDVMAAKEFLENRTQRTQFNLNIKTLLSKEATRANLVKAFEEHLGQAREGDIAFFYYSGHGSQEPAGKWFEHEEEDNMNETLVCWDSRIEDGMDLADNELATLIELVSQKNPTIVTMLDCCHSGSGTRDIGSTPPSDYLVRQSPGTKKVRTLDSYILPRNIMSKDRSVLAAKGTEALSFPEGRHIGLAAAESFELAKETKLGGNRRGVFSFSLMEMLQTSTGDFTYMDLMRRVRTMVAKRTFDQTPTIYASQTEDLDKFFLDNAASVNVEDFNLSFSREEGWKIDGGAVHGILPGTAGGDTTELSVFPGTASNEDMQDLSKALGTAEVVEVLSNRSKVFPSAGLQLERNAAYRCRILSLPVNPAKVFFFGDTKGIGFLEERLNAGGPLASYVTRANSLADADYKLLAVRDMYILSRVADGMGDQAIISRDGIDYRPLVEQVQGYSKDSADKVLDQVQHITKWGNVMALSNPGSRIPSSAIQIELWHPTKEEKLAPGEGGHHFKYARNGDFPSFRLRLFNGSNKKYFCSLLYMSSQFGADPDLFAEGGVWLEPGQDAWA